MFLQALTFFLLTLALTQGELIQLQHQDHLLCITDDLKDLLYLSPPIVEDGKDGSVLLDDDTKWNDWSLVNSKQVVVPPVYDKRWEDFETRYIDSVHFDSVRSLSCSVFGNSVSIITRDSTRKTVEKRTRDVDIDWNFGTTYPTDQKSPIQIDASSEKKTYWKIHDYNLRWTDTLSNNFTIFNVTRSDLSCLDVYVYLCPVCELDVTVDDNPNRFQGLTTVGNWQHKTIQVTPGSTIAIARGVITGDSGEWAIDIRKCPARTPTNKIVYHPDLSKDVHPNVTRGCHLYATEDSNKYPFDCEFGVMGENCDISCREFLGDDRKYCEEYEICSGNDRHLCLCAWGYEGPACDQVCEKGKWGMSCISDCDGCRNCDAQTGNCPDSAASNIAFVALLITGAVAGMFL